MTIVFLDLLHSFARRQPQARGPIEAWIADARSAEWMSPMDVKRRHASASFLKDRRVVFHIGGNKFRLVTKVNYEKQRVAVLFIGTHAEYDTIDAESVQ